MIDFELSEGVQNTQRMVHAVAEQMMRPIAREYDEREHEKPWEFLRTMWQVSHANPIGGSGDRRKDGPSERNLAMCVSIEELSWGDAGLYLSIPNAGLGGAAVAAAGTPSRRSAFSRASAATRPSGRPWPSPSPDAARTAPPSRRRRCAT